MRSTTSIHTTAVRVVVEVQFRAHCHVVSLAPKTKCCRKVDAAA
jgi:hypothetical protein